MLKPSEQFHEYLFEAQGLLDAAYSEIFINEGLRTPDDYGLVSFFLTKAGKVTNVRIVSKCDTFADKTILQSLEHVDKRLGKMPDFFDKPGVEVAFMYGPKVRLRDRDPFTGSYADRYRYLDQLSTTQIPDGDDAGQPKEIERKTQHAIETNEAPQTKISPSDAPSRSSPEEWNRRLALQQAQADEKDRQVLKKLFDFNEVCIFLDSSVSATENTLEAAAELFAADHIKIVQNGDLHPNVRLLKLSAKKGEAGHFKVHLHFGESNDSSTQFVIEEEINSAFNSQIIWMKDFNHEPKNRKELQEFVLVTFKDFLERSKIAKQTGVFCDPISY